MGTQIGSLLLPSSSKCKTCGITTSIVGSSRKCITCTMSEIDMIQIDSSSTQSPPVILPSMDSFRYMEYMADLLAIGDLKPNEYFKLKHLLRSEDHESRTLAKNIIDSRIKLKEK